MQISSIQPLSARSTTDLPDRPPTDSIQDRTRKDHIRQLAQAVKVINDSGQIAFDRELAIALDRNTGQPVTRLIDRQTREVVQQIPEERVLRMAEEFKRASAQRAGPGGTDWLSTLA